MSVRRHKAKRSFPLLQSKTKNQKFLENLASVAQIRLIGLILEVTANLPVSSEISDLCKISDLLLFVGYFASQSKEIKFGDYFLMCVV